MLVTGVGVRGVLGRARVGGGVIVGRVVVGLRRRGWRLSRGLSMSGLMRRWMGIVRVWRRVSGVDRGLDCCRVGR